MYSRNKTFHKYGEIWGGKIQDGELEDERKSLINSPGTLAWLDKLQHARELGKPGISSCWSGTGES